MASRLHQRAHACVCVRDCEVCDSPVRMSRQEISALTWTERHIDGAADRNKCWCHVFWEGENCESQKHTDIIQTLAAQALLRY